MSRKLSGPRIKAKLSEVIEHHLKSYSIAAAAAGVSMFALTQPADAEVIVTRTNISVGSTPIFLDINDDGIADFKFSYYLKQPYNGRDGSLNVRPLRHDAVVGDFGRPDCECSYAVALYRGASVGPSAHFGSQERAVIERFGFYAGPLGYFFELYGNWANVSDRYLGVKFLIDGRPHYGWVRLTVDAGDAYVGGTITAYAYETVPNKPIIAGPPEDPSTYSKTPQTGRRFAPPFLGILALGAHGLPLWRREEIPAY
jgi:hypothetical protein